MSEPTQILVKRYPTAPKISRPAEDRQLPPYTDAALVSARNQTQIDLSMAGDYALLGALVDHLFAHAVSDAAPSALDASSRASV